MERKNVTLTTVTPLLIGSWEGAGLLGYEFVVEGKKAYRVDINKLLSKLSEEQTNALADLMAEPYKGFSVGDYIRKHNINPGEIALYEVEPQIEKAQKTYNVHICVKDGLQRVYIPGSSIKGALRRNYEAFENAANGIRKFSSREDFGRFETQLDNLFTGSKGRRFGVRDTSYLRASPEVLALCSYEIHTEYRRGHPKCREGGMIPQQTKIYAEVIKPGVKFENEMWSDIPLDEILKRSDGRCRKFIKRELEYFKKYALNKMYDSVRLCYEKLEKTDGTIVRLGQGSSFFMTSLIGDTTDTALYHRILPEPRRGRAGETIPNSRKLVRYKTELLPPGWVVITCK